MSSSPTERFSERASTDESVAKETITLVRKWLADSSGVPVDRQAARLAAVLGDPLGLPFAVGFIDGVIRPEDVRVAARNLARLADQVPPSLPWYLRSGVRLASVVSRVSPQWVIPVVRRALRGLVSHLIVDARERRLGRAIIRLRRRGVRLNLNLLGEAVLGEREAVRRLAGTKKLVARDDVDYVSIKVSSAVAPHADWAFEETVAEVVHALTPLFEQAANSGPTFINLDMEEYRDLDLTVAVFTSLLDQPKLLDFEAGIVLQAYLPDALGTMIRLQEWAAARRARGGAPIRVRVVKGANLPMERVDAELHGWPLATWASKQQTDTNYKRVLDYALDPVRVASVRIGVASHNLFDLAYAWVLAGRRGVRDQIQVEMLLGMAQSQAEVVRRETGGLVLYTPVVHPTEFDVAIAYLVRRLEEGASQANFLSAAFAIDHDRALFDRERDRFLASLIDLNDLGDSGDRAATVPHPLRTQDRSGSAQPATSFSNAPDTDPALAANREWARRIVARVPTSTLGATAVTTSRVTTSEHLDQLIEDTRRHSRSWGTLSGRQRGEVLRQVGQYLEDGRGDLIEVMASEAGKTLDQADPEVSEAVDFANYYAERAHDLDTLDGAVFTPSELTVVTPPWNFPIAIPAGSVLAALASGSAVILKPAPQSARCGAVLAEIFWAAGVPREVLRLINVDEVALGRELISDTRVDRVVLTGSYETAELFRSFRPDLPLLAETSGKNAIVVTPSADIDLAVRDVVRSAFGHAGQKCSAASLLILVGSLASSRRFHDQLLDATSSLRVGPPESLGTQVGPLIEPAAGKLHAALTVLDPGEHWILEPQQRDSDGRLWTPGIRGGVVRGSRAHLTEFFGPMLAVMTAANLSEAIELQNEVDFGLTAGLHSLDPEEIALWLDRVEAGNLYVNKGITGAIVQRQPFGGWKRSTVGTGFKAGGPHHLLGFGSWTSAPATAGADLGAQARELLVISRPILAPQEHARLTRALTSDAAAWKTVFSAAHDITGLRAERNVLRYRPTSVHVRLAPTGTPSDLIRVLAAGRLAGASLTVSTDSALPDRFETLLAALGVTATVQPDQEWYDNLTQGPAVRIRLIGAAAASVLAAAQGRPDVAVYCQPVTESGVLEMLPFLREQAISITTHRFGTHHDLSAGLL